MFVRVSALTLLIVSVVPWTAPAVGQVTQPIYRVAKDAAPSAVAPTATKTTQLVSATTPAAPFDFTLQPGEHPLMPCIRVAKQGLEGIDANIKDYQAIFTKTERLNGKPGEKQQIMIKVRNEPFSVYMKFINPYPNREVLYVANQNEGNLVALDSGFKRRLGKMSLAPDGMLAMRGQRYPITKCGIRNLTAELIKIAEKDIEYGECEVKYNHAVKIDGRPVTMMEIIHPVARKNFRFHKARIFVDHELKIPVMFDAYSWPEEEGGQPILEEQYIYTSIKLNNGFTDADFSPDNPNLFK